jgi:cell division protein FtsQ
LRPLNEIFGLGRSARPAFASPSGSLASAPHAVLLRGERARRGALWRRLNLDRPLPRGVGLVLSIGLLAAVAGVGVARGGQYQAFVAKEGGIGDFIARGLGFGVKVVTISGQSRLTERAVLDLAGVSPKDSLPFFDVETARARLEATPLVKQASVRKLFPGQIVIDLVERTPAALWQREGEVRTIAADGAVIDELRDAGLANLPFVVGDGANERLGEFLGLLDAMQELRTKVEAGVLVGGRRWNLKMKSGVDVKLPETDPQDAVATLVRLQRQARVLDRDILWLDLRTPGRAFARLSADAAAARDERLSPHAKKGAAL